MSLKMLSGLLVLLLLVACGSAARQDPKQPTPISTPEPVVMVSAATFRYQGGDDGCRYMAPQRLVTFAGELTFEIIAGDGGPYNFSLVDDAGRTLVDIPIGHGETAYATVRLDELGPYWVYDGQRPRLGAISQVTARPRGEPGASIASTWCNDN